MGPVCEFDGRVTDNAAYKALLNANCKAGDWVVIPGAGGGLGHLAVQVRSARALSAAKWCSWQYALAMNYRVCGIDAGDDKRELLKGYGAHAYVNFTKEAVRAATLGACRAEHRTYLQQSSER